MSTSTSSSFNPLKIALTATGVIAAATVSYAVYFDYRRRNDAVFRKNILKEYKKVDKKVKHAQEQGKEQIQAALKRAIALANAEPVPVTAEGKEQFFMEQVALAEQLAARSPEFYVAAAISFYKALKVYPAPQELIMIYQKSLPPAVFDLVMELISLEIHAASSSSSSRTTGPSQQIQEEPILQELSEAEADEKKKRSQQVDEDDEEEEEIKVGTTTATTAAASSSDDKPKTTEEEEEESGAGAGAAANKAPSSTTGSDSSPSSGSFVHVETDNNTVSNEVVGAVEEDKESTPAVVATTSSEDPPEEPIVAA
ncbi:hypothetical protein JCM3766R1_002653 [Sporobolomyces carnicolor]